LLYTRRIAARGRHIAEQNIALAAAALPLLSTPSPFLDLSSRVRRGGRGIGISSADFKFPLPCDAEHERWADAARQRVGTFAILNPGAGWGAKCWPAERYAAVAMALKRHGITSLVNYGPGEEDLVQAVIDGARAAPGAVEALRCGVGQLIALTRRARLLVGGDTGPTHLAAALGVPVVALYGPTDPRRNGPIGSRAIVLRHQTSTTSHARRAQSEAGLLQITGDEAIAAARRLLAESAPS
jgi:heptosyltransferase-1